MFLRSASQYLLFAYRKLRDGSNTTGSPLDIPVRTVFLALLLAVLLVIVFGNALFYSIYAFVSVPPVNFHTDTDDIRHVAVVDLLVPEWKRNLASSADSATINMLDSAFFVRAYRADEPVIINEVSPTTLAKFIRQTKLDTSFSAKEANGLIVGQIRHNILMMPYLDDQAADEIANTIGLFKNYTEDNMIGKDRRDWERILTLSAIQKMRDRLDGGLSFSFPRRILLAIGGGLQWITFVAATWCGILLLFLRIPWAYLQREYALAGRLPWEGHNEVNIWEKTDRAEYLTYLYAQKNYQGTFLANRLVEEVGEHRGIDYGIARINAYRDRVEVGEYELINFLLWAVPTFGFIGTIFGIIDAMENASAIFSAADQVEQAVALDGVSAALGTAFDTSFVALITLVALSFLVAWARKAEANLFEILEHRTAQYLTNE